MSNNILGFLNNNNKQKNLNFTIKDFIGRMLSLLCNKHAIPFKFINCQSFKSFCQELVKYGETNKMKDISEILPEESTVRFIHTRNLYHSYLVNAKIITDKIKYVSVTADLWLHKTSNVNFLGVTSHFINDKFLLCKIIPGLCFIDPPKTGVKIYLITKNLLEVIFPIDIEYCYTTDRGSNMVSAFSDDKSLKCIAHGINNVIQDLFRLNLSKNQIKELEEIQRDPDDIFVEEEEEVDSENDENIHNVFEEVERTIKTLINNSKKIVRYFKKSGLNNELKTKLRQECPTRWNSYLTMLDSIIKNYTDIIKTLKENKKTIYIDFLEKNYSEFTIICDFLQPLKEITETLSREDKPNIHLVLPSIITLKNLLKIK